MKASPFSFSKMSMQAIEERNSSKKLLTLFIICSFINTSVILVSKNPNDLHSFGSPDMPIKGGTH
ncbi:hypothetical protein UP17_14560 [Peribacillus simplex]|nr:hypothetical protein UP17_14560 [Peribacillus simplex]